MKRRLQIVCVAAALLLGGWAGALAAVLCPHAGGAEAESVMATHNCCRPNDGDDKEGASCPMRMGDLVGNYQPASDDSHAASQRTHGQSFTHPRAAVESQPREKRTATLARRVDLCAHCVFAPTAPWPASSERRAPETVKRGGECEASRARKLLAPHVAPFVRDIVPLQGAPPAAARLHVLNSTFLI